MSIPAISLTTAGLYRKSNSFRTKPTKPSGSFKPDLAPSSRHLLRGLGCPGSRRRIHLASVLFFQDTILYCAFLDGHSRCGSPDKSRAHAFPCLGSSLGSEAISKCAHQRFRQHGSQGDFYCGEYGDISNETSCAGGAPQGMKMGFNWAGERARSVAVVQAFVRGDCLKVGFSL